MVSMTYTMNNSKSCQSGHIDGDKTEALEWDNCKSQDRDHVSQDRDHVNTLLDISEEYSFREQEPYEVQIPVGWEEAIQGWGRFTPLACLLQAQRYRRKVKPDAIDSHCLLCAELKDLRLSGLPESDCAGTSSEMSSQAAEKPLKNTVSAPIELLNTSPRNSSSCSSTSEEEPFDLLSIEERNTKSDTLGNKPMFGGEQFVHNKTPPHHFQRNVQCPFLKDRGSGKVALMGTLMILPPVRPPTPIGNLRSVPISKRREALWPKVGVDNSTGPVAEKVNAVEDHEKALPYRSSPVDQIYQGSLTTKYGPTQHQYHLLSIPVSRKAPLPFSPLEGSLPQASSMLGRNFNQEDLARLPFRHISGHRANSSFKARCPKRAEPELPMLLGTRVAIPVSAQRLL